MAEKKPAQDPAKAAFLAALEKKKQKGSAHTESHTDGKGAARAGQSGVTRRIERRRSGSS